MSKFLKIDVNGQFVEAQRVMFRAIPGVSPSILRLIVSHQTADAVLSNLTQPTTQRSGVTSATITITANDIVREEESKLVCKRFVVMPPEANNQFETTLEFRDRREWWSRKAVSGFYNMRRKTNEFIQLDPQGVVSVNKLGYIASTLNAEVDGGQPWTSTQLIRTVIEELEPRPVLDLQSLDSLIDNGYILDNQAIYFEPLDRVLHRWLQTAYVMVSHDPYKDKIYFYKPDAGVTHIQPFMKFYEGGAARVINFEATRPRQVRVGFLAERQIPIQTRDAFDAYTVETGRYTGGRPKHVGDDQVSTFNDDEIPFCENVLKLPQNIILNNKVVAQRGQWVPIREALTLWAAQDIQDRDRVGKGKSILAINSTQTITSFNFAPDNKQLPPPGKRATYPLINMSWFVNLTQWLYATNFTKIQDTKSGIWQFFDPEKSARVTALRQHYRQTFQIESTLMAHIIRWHTRDVDIIDTATGTRSFNPVFTQYCIVPGFRPPEATKGSIYEDIGINHLGHNIDDFNNPKNSLTLRRRLGIRNGDFHVEDAEDAVFGSPFVMSVIDHDIGIFRIDPLPDLTGIIGEIIPSMVDNIPAKAFHDTAIAVWQNAVLARQFQMRTSITAFMIPKVNLRASNVANFVGVDKEGENASIADAEEWALKVLISDASTGGPTGKGDPVNILMERDTARIRADGEWLNRDVCDGLAIATAKRVYYSYRDRTLGRFSLRGLREIRLNGHVKFIQWDVEQDGHCSTLIDFRSPPEPPPLQALLGRGVRDVAFRLINTAGDLFG